MPLDDTDDIIYRNTTGNFVGKGSPLTSLEGDNNNFEIAGAIVNLQTQMAAVGAGIDTITQPTPNTLLITLTDATVFGPFTLPTAPMNGRGEWQPSVSYAVNDILYYGSAFYVVEFTHVSEATFDPGANDGNGHNYYGLIFDMTEGGSVIRQATYQEEINTTHTISSFDPGVIWDCTHASGCTVTIPNDTTYDAPIDTEVSFRQGASSGVVSFSTAGGVTLDTGIFLPSTTFQGAVVTLKKIAANSWLGWGYLSA
jgi:hypothetical protein